MLNIKGDVEMDAMVMDGQTLASGAVAAVRNIANPVQLSRLVMDKVWQSRLLRSALFASVFFVLEEDKEENQSVAKRG